MHPPTDDPRVRRGMRAQLALRDGARARGDRQTGWKLGLGSPEAMARLDTSGPVVGVLTERRTLSGDATVDTAGWVRPFAEPEIAVHIARDIRPDEDLAQIATAIAGVSAAIELVDLPAPVDDLESALAGNLFHRAAVVGPRRAGWEGIAGDLRCNGRRAATIEAPFTVVPAPAVAVQYLARYLDPLGERVRAGEVLISGALALVGVSARDELALRLAGCEPVAVTLA